MSKNPRLKFTKEEQAAPELKKPVRRADKAAGRADKAQAKIPKKVVKTNERVVNPQSGKVRTHQYGDSAKSQDFVGRGGARERTQFSASAGNGVERTLRRQEDKKKPSSNLSHAVKSAPGRALKSLVQ